MVKLFKIIYNYSSYLKTIKPNHGIFIMELESNARSQLVPYGQSSNNAQPQNRTSTIILTDVSLHTPLLSHSRNIQEKEIKNLSSLPGDLLSHVEEMQSICEKDSSVMNFFALRKAIDAYNKTRFWCLCFCGHSPADDAEDFYENAVFKLNVQDQSNIENLIRSFIVPMQVKTLHLPEGIYSGLVLNGVAHGENGEFKKITAVRTHENDNFSSFVLNYTLKGTFEHGNFIKGTKSFESGVVETGEFENDKLIKGFIEGLKKGTIALNIEVNGATYSGGWLDNRPDGPGTFTDSEGNIVEGVTTDGIFKKNEQVDDSFSQLSILDEEDLDEEDFILGTDSTYKAETKDERAKKPTRTRKAVSVSSCYSPPPKKAPKKEKERKECSSDAILNIQRDVEKSVMKARNCCNSSVNTTKDDLKECVTEMMEIALNSCVEMKNNPDASAAKHLILSAEKIRKSLSAIKESKNENASLSAKKRLSKVFEADPEIFSDSDYDAEQDEFEKSLRFKCAEEFLFGDIVYAEIVNLRAAIDSVETLKELEIDTKDFEESYQESLQGLSNLLSSSPNIDKDQLLELLTKFPLDELCILREIKDKENFEDVCLHELNPKKLKIYWNEIQEWKKVFKKYSQEIGSVLNEQIEFLKENPQAYKDSQKHDTTEMSQAPYSPYKGKRQDDLNTNV